MIKENTSILIMLILIFLTSYFLYWKGELDINKTSQNFTVLAFENTDLSCNREDLTFFIENNSKEEVSYQVSINADDKSLENMKILISAQDKKLVYPSSETISSLCTQLQKIKYEVIIKNKSNKQSVYKFINI